MLFQQMKLRTKVIPHCHVILTGQSISKIILNIQGHLQGQKVYLKVNQNQYFFTNKVIEQIKVGTHVIPFFMPTNLFMVLFW